MLCHKPAVKAIFFDLDNVLVFSEIHHFTAWQKVIAYHGIDPSQIHFHDMVGKSDWLQALLFIERFGIGVSAQSLWVQKRDLFLALSPKTFEHPQGRNAFLEKLSQFYTVGLVSSSASKVVQEVIASENIAHHFAFTIAFEDCQKHKPHPEPYLFALEKAKIQPHEALVIEDSVSGIRAAQEAKIPVVGILKDQSPDQILKEVLYFHSFTEIDKWLHP